ncbi:diguanylate cyclase [Burkholderia sp. SRS-W-2-2016]|uniref:dihydroneopterin aldolase n=1 Tax=Burkholderia sp. SRS-W-2-2016 TaxID=1926878 RepID=UPI00094B73A5|nr:dihydroneopterin aldolase [Burkholderia sp. SRS-W-2-2016]OLL31274.1 diguanylate cyclase [Burkholderia sp. SRS-W-2-2016]
MKPVEEPFGLALATNVTSQRGRGWSVFIEALGVPARVGIYPHEQSAPQALVIDARLGYGSAPSEEHGWIDYDGYCTSIADFLAHKPHTRLLETLVADIAKLSFRQWPALESLTLSVHKPKIRPGTRCVGVTLDWTRADYLLA